MAAVIVMLQRAWLSVVFVQLHCGMHHVRMGVE
jgi:hypothetical protein